MIALIGIFVITSSACVSTIEKGNPLTMEYLIKTEKCSDKFISVSSSPITSANEISRPVCEWISHQWIEIYNYKSNHELNQCIYCDKKRVRKEVWEDVK